VRVSEFHFDLPEELIAQRPPAVRGASRMLVYERRSTVRPPVLTDALFVELPQYLRPGDLLVLNDSRVLPSRLYAVRAGTTTQAIFPAPTGRIEVLLIEQLDSRTEAVNHHGPGAAPHPNLWRVLCRPARKVLPGETLLFFDPAAAGVSQPVLTAEVTSQGPFGERTLRFAPLPSGIPDFHAVVSRIGHMPLPPYIRRDQANEPDSAEDRDRYQTVYAQDPRTAPPGSAAAPTAGLHFTPEMLSVLESRGVEIAYLTLHVGLGTFQPVRVADLADIRLHAERYTVPASTADVLNRALRQGRRIIAVGTTTTRTLEHIALEAANAAGPEAPPQVRPHSGETSIFISPGHRFRIVQGLLTNFHLPESTLLMLVVAFAANSPLSPAENKLARTTGAHPPQSPFQLTDPDLARRHISDAYTHAVRQRYNFFSYGDCMLLV
jgi:S-adenosylmethionine:tRNA ribosyltransferase-isomerase